MLSDNLAARDAVSRYRNALWRGTPPEELARLAGALDPAIVRVMRLLREAAGQNPVRPDGDFAARLERDLVEAAARSPRSGLPTIPAHGRVFPGSKPAFPAAIAQPDPAATGWRCRALAQAPTAAMLALTVAFVFFVFGLWRPGSVDLSIGRPTGVNLAAPDAGQLSFLWESTGGPDGFRRAYGLAVAPDGNLWVTDGAKGQIAILAPDGTFLEEWGTPGSGEGQFNFIGSYFGDGTIRGDIAFDASGNIYVADTGNHRVQKFAPDRSFLRSWGKEGSDEGQFLVPASIAVDASGAVYVSDVQRNDIQKFNGDGHYLGVIGSSGEGEGRLKVPAGVAVDGVGDIWVANFGSDRIKQFGSDGKLLSTWGVLGSRQGELSDPNDVAVDQEGRVYVLDQTNRRAQVFTADGQFLTSVGGFGGGPGFFNLPAAVAIGDDGMVFVSDRNSVQAFTWVMGDG